MAAAHRSAAEGSRAQRRTPASWGPASVGRRMCGWGRSGKRSAERTGAGAVRRSMAARPEGPSSRVPKGWLCAAVGLETGALDTHSLGQMRDESHVTLSQELAEAGWECEAPDGASSCQSGRHGCPHLHRADHRNTDLRWGWVGSPAAEVAAAAAAAAPDAGAGHRRRHGSQEAVAARRHRTWAGERQRRARRCVQEQRPVSGQRRG